MVSILIGLTIAGAQKKPVRNVSSSRSTNSSQTMDREARRLDSQYWNKMIKCGRSYFLYADVRLFEFRDKPQFSFYGQALKPKPLSRVEILNRVDPLPVEWDGGSNVSFEVCRMNTAAYGYGRTFWDGWGNWTSQHCEFGTRIWRAKGKWNIDSLRHTSCGELADWGLIPKVRETGVIRVDSSKDPAVCWPKCPLLPYPNGLIVQVKAGNRVFLNSEPMGTEPMGTLDDLSSLTRKLIDVFRKRRQQRAFLPGTTEIMSTVWIQTGTADTGRQNSLTEFEIQKIIKALKAAGANPIKISDRTPPLTVPADPNLFPPDQRIIEYGDPKSKGAKPSPSPPG